MDVLNARNRSFNSVISRDHNVVFRARTAPRDLLARKNPARHSKEPRDPRRFARWLDSGRHCYNEGI